jgi:hypothetical protein
MVEGPIERSVRLSKNLRLEHKLGLFWEHEAGVAGIVYKTQPAMAHVPNLARTVARGRHPKPIRHSGFSLSTPSLRGLSTGTAVVCGRHPTPIRHSHSGFSLSIPSPRGFNLPCGKQHFREIATPDGVGQFTNLTYR